MFNKQVVVCFSFLVLLSLRSYSQWNASSAVNTPVCTSTKDQQNLSMVTDGKGGVIVAWEDSRNSSLTKTDIYVQRLDKNGIVKWTVNGIAVCVNDSDQSAVDITADGNGGAILTWGDNRNGQKDIYAQKVDSTGAIQWAVNGISVCMKAGDQSAPRIIGDKNGGGIVVWEDLSAANSDIYMQRISNAGAILWASSGIAICTNTLSQNNPRITPDSVGGAIIAWQDFRNGNDYDIYAQRVDASGAVKWTSQGVVVCNVIGTQNNPKVKPDGSSGAIIVWADKRGVANDVYAQRLDASGAAKWTANGAVICNAIGSQSALAITTSGISGAIIAWKDQRSGNYEDIYAQKVSLSGAVSWTANGVPVITGALSQKNVSVAGDGSGGAVIVWQDSTSTGWDVYGQRIDANGTKQWSVNGIAVGTATNDQIFPDNVSDGKGGCIFAFQDKRNTLDFDIYAHHLYADGTTVDIIPEYFFLAESKCSPNPFSASANIEVNSKLSGLQGPLSFLLYDVFGKKTEMPFSFSENRFKIARGNLQNGIYFYEVMINSTTISTGKFVLVD